MLPAVAVASLGSATLGPLIGLAMIWLLNRAGMPWLTWAYDKTILAPVLAMSVRVLPLAFLVCWLGIRSVPQDLLDGAMTDGATGGRLFRSVVLPHCWHVPVVAWLAAAAITAGDLGATVLVTPPGVSTLTIRIFGLLHAGVDDQLASICLTTLLLFVLVTVLVTWCAGRARIGRVF